MILIADPRTWISHERKGVRCLALSVWANAEIERLNATHLEPNSCAERTIVRYRVETFFSTLTGVIAILFALRHYCFNILSGHRPHSARTRSLGGFDQTATVTRRKVAGMEVAFLLGLLFWLLNRASSSFCRSAARPFFSAASNAFMVGP